DGNASKSIIITNEAILKTTKANFLSNTADVAFVKEVYSKLNQFYNITLGELPNESLPFTLQEFCYKYNLNILKTYNALQILEREEIIKIDANFSNKSTLKFIISSAEIFKFIEKTTTAEASLLKLILRTYGGVLEYFTIINEYFLAKKLAIPKQEVSSYLQKLAIKNILKYNQQTAAAQLKFLVARDNNYAINSISKNIKQQNNHKINKLSSIIGYITNSEMCRVQFLFQYFNENIPPKCEQCDVCVSKKHYAKSQDASAKILHALAQQNLSTQQLLNIIDENETALIKRLKILIEENKITINSQNQFKLKD
ncbi:MAG TPA: RecQ family zinc-binding domain-containing protein, partial [Flavobacteriaceae bacterium]|nr:RecQ family zinc-binding domain-containing protein [Flavobacteriaceae bacterium]